MTLTAWALNRGQTEQGGGLTSGVDRLRGLTSGICDHKASRVPYLNYFFTSFYKIKACLMSFKFESLDLTANPPANVSTGIKRDYPGNSKPARIVIALLFGLKVVIPLCLVTFPISKYTF